MSENNINATDLANLAMASVLCGLATGQVNVIIPFDEWEELNRVSQRYDEAGGALILKENELRRIVTDRPKELGMFLLCISAFLDPDTHILRGEGTEFLVILIEDPYTVGRTKLAKVSLMFRIRDNVVAESTHRLASEAIEQAANLMTVPAETTNEAREYLRESFAEAA